MFKKLLQIAIILALIVVLLGAYTRLADAGLGCPDWPLCYGQFGLPDAPDGSKLAGFEQIVQADKVWKEVFHRYAAAALGLIILVLFLLVLTGKTQRPQAIKLPAFGVFFVMLQGAFGMWTVTLLVHPGIVTIHLIGGFITTSLLAWMLFNQSQIRYSRQVITQNHKNLLLIVLVVLSMQIILGGWTSTNYAALSCGAEFPTCLNSWWPEMDFAKAFTWGPIGANYEFGLLENPARVAIQMSHRIGALLATGLILALIFMFKNLAHLKTNLRIILIILAAQITLGISNVLLNLPIIIATLHNLMALLLLLSLLKLAHTIYRKPLNS